VANVRWNQIYAHTPVNYRDLTDVSTSKVDRRWRQRASSFVLVGGVERLASPVLFGARRGTYRGCSYPPAATTRTSPPRTTEKLRRFQVFRPIAAAGVFRSFCAFDLSRPAGERWDALSFARNLQVDRGRITVALQGRRPTPDRGRLHHRSLLNVAYFSPFFRKGP